MVNLEAKVIDSGKIIITEHNASKDYKKFPELYVDTPYRIRRAIESGKTGDIPPIIALQNPFGSIDATIESYRRYVALVPRQGGKNYECEEEVLKEILDQNPLLCYNGNRRLEGFQKAKLPIKALVICSQEEYDGIPQEERRIPEDLKSKNPTQYQIDRNFILSYLGLLDDVVYIKAEKRHWDNFDWEVLREMREKRNKNK